MNKLNKRMAEEALALLTTLEKEINIFSEGGVNNVIRSMLQVGCIGACRSLLNVAIQSEEAEAESLNRMVTESVKPLVKYPRPKQLNKSSKKASKKAQGHHGKRSYL